MPSCNVDVSVVTPVFNGAHHLNQAVQSVLLQEGISSYEHIIVNDGSTDGTHELIEQLQGRDPRLRCFHQPNRGAGAARNLAIEAAQGRYIVFLDTDDVWLEGKLKAQINFMQHDQVVFSYGDYAIHRRTDNQCIGVHHAPSTVTYRDLLSGCPIGCLTAGYDQEALGKVYMPRVKRGQDWGLWLALARLGGPARKYPGNLAAYLHGGQSLSANKLAKLRDVYTIYREQEGLGRLAASVYLARHAASALGKRP